MGYFIDNPLRHLIHNPVKILRPYVRSGMTVIDVGCGMGIFSIAMAKLVGDEGQVLAVDLQQKMLDAMLRRARRAGVDQRIIPHRCQADRLGMETPADFILAFAVVHEVPDMKNFLSQINACLKPDGKFLVAEPRLHVRTAAFQQMLTLTQELGLRIAEHPKIRRSRSVVLVKKQTSFPPVAGKGPGSERFSR
jgi:ubiquinone/menaquinone biosynthesis C-methylase UbiE